MTNISIKKVGNVLLNVVYKIVCKKPKVLTDKETVEYIINSQCSVSRFGDGELNLMLGNSIRWFQKYNKSIAEDLKETANYNDSRLLICIPETIVNEKMSLLTNDAKNWWKKHRLLVGGHYYRFFCNNKFYGDTNFTRFYLGIEDKNNIDNYVKELKKLWNKRNLLIVEGYNSKLGIGNDLFNNSKSIRRIVCPNKDAYEKYAEIKSAVLNNYSKNDLVITALGPTATILSADLCVNHNIQTFDLGHIDIEYMWFVNKSNGREKIENKNTAEVQTLEHNKEDITPGTVEIIE